MSAFGEFASLICFDLLLYCLFNGWLQAIQAIQKSWAVVNLHEGAQFLLTRRLNQDTLEHFFSLIRSRSGFRDNLTPYEFLHAFKQASTTCCIDVAHQLVPILLSSAQRCRDTSLPTRPNVVNSSACVAPDRSDCNVAHCMTLLESNSYMYFAGYLEKQLYACNDCSTCHNVVDCDMAAEDTSASLFLSFKAYSPTSKLCAQNALFIRYIRDCEGVYSFAIKDAVHKPNLKSTLQNVITHNVDSPSTLCATGNHFVLQLFVRSRIYFHLKCMNKNVLQRNEKIERHPRL